jgi:hypothetical protein
MSYVIYIDVMELCGLGFNDTLAQMLQFCIGCLPVKVGHNK